MSIRCVCCLLTLTSFFSPPPLSLVYQIWKFWSLNCNRSCKNGYRGNTHYCCHSNLFTMCIFIVSIINERTRRDCPRDSWRNTGTSTCYSGMFYQYMYFILCLLLYRWLAVFQQVCHLLRLGQLEFL